MQLKKFHTLCTAAKLSGDEKMAIIHGRGVESSAEIGIRELKEICGALERQIAGPKVDGMDKLRKRVIAAIGGWLTIEGRESNAAIIKAIACRATEHKSFNKIPAERLRNLYYTFLNKQKDKGAVDAITTPDVGAGLAPAHVGRPQGSPLRVVVLNGQTNGIVN